MADSYAFGVHNEGHTHVVNDVFVSNFVMHDAKHVYFNTHVVWTCISNQLRAKLAYVFVYIRQLQEQKVKCKVCLHWKFAGTKG